MSTHKDIPGLDVEEQLFAGVIHSSPGQCQGLLTRLKDVNIKNGSQRTLLHIAVTVGKYSWVERLLARGADPLIRDGRSLTVLAVAVEMAARNPKDRSHKRILKLLRSVKIRGTANQCTSMGGESSTDSNPRIGPGLNGELSTVSPATQDTSSFNGSIEKFRQEMLSLQEALSQDVGLLRGVVQELRTSMEKAIDEVKVGLTSRDTLLEKLEVSVTTLAERCGPLKELVNERNVRASEARGGLEGGSGSPLGNLLNIDVSNKEDIRNKCIEAMMLKTRCYPRCEAKLEYVRSLYEKLYRISPITSCVLRFLQYQIGIFVVVDCWSNHIGRFKRLFTNLSGKNCEGSCYGSFAEFKEKRLYLGAGLVKHYGVRKVTGELAMSLAQMSMFLAFKNEGRPFVAGDNERSAQYTKAIEEARETWPAEDCFLHAREALDNGSQLEREVVLISAIPAMIARFGSTNGTLRVYREMRSVHRFYEDHVMPTLLRGVRAAPLGSDAFAAPSLRYRHCVDYLSSGSCPSIYLAWVALPGAINIAPASTALGVIGTHKPFHHDKVVVLGEGG